MIRLALLAAIAGCGAAPRPSAPHVPAGPLPTLRIGPSPAYVELSDRGQSLDCDLIVDNTAGGPRTIERIQVTAFDESGAVAFRRFIDGNGVSPSIKTVPNRDIPAHAKVLVLNPLASFAADIPLARVRFEVELGDGTISSEVVPVVYRNRATLRVPLHGRMIVWDGHDTLAHHRRWDYVFEPIRAMGFTTNAGRYSYDLVPIDETGAMFHGDEKANESWLGFRAPVLSPAAGVVVVASDREPDNRNFDVDSLKQDLMNVYGNRVVVDHGNGEFSVFGHLAQGSLKVKVGARVEAGQAIAAVGASGSAMFPHLHYQLQSTATGAAEGLPSYFHAFTRVRGTKRIDVASGQIDSGEIIEAQ